MPWIWPIKTRRAQHMQQASLVWSAEKWPATEMFQYFTTADGYLATGHMTGIVNATPFALEYKINLNPHWIITAAHIRSLTNVQQSIGLHHNGQGQWEDANGQLLAPLQGCMDIDISLTPFTNTLPIRRLSWQEGVPQVIDVAYINVPAFKVEHVRQRYTLLRKGVFLYENMHNDFKAELNVDEHGLVIHYPDLYARVFAEVVRE